MRYSKCFLPLDLNLEKDIRASSSDWFSLGLKTIHNYVNEFCVYGGYKLVLVCMYVELICTVCICLWKMEVNHSKEATYLSNFGGRVSHLCVVS